MASASDRPPDASRARPSRRDLLSGASIAAGCGAVGVAAWPAARFIAAPGPDAPAAQDVQVCADSELSPGQMRLVRVGTRTVAVLRRHDGSLSAFDSACTHLGCTVRFRPEKDALHCGCHGALFHAGTGARQAGPADRPLTPIGLEVRDGRIFVRA